LSKSKIKTAVDFKNALENFSMDILNNLEL